MAMIGFSCKKMATSEPMGNAGQTIVKLTTDDGELRTVHLTLVATPQKVNLLEIRRDIPSEGELNKPMAVIIHQDQGIVADYNTANGTTFIPLPPGSYTVDAANPRTGSDWTVTFAPGEFVKFMTITIPNALAIDLTQTYALGFTISSAAENGKISADQSKAVVEIGVSNDWEADYNVTGYLFHPTAPRAISTAKHLYTVGATTCEAGLGDLEGSGYYLIFDITPANTLTNWIADGACPPAPQSGFFTADNPGGTIYAPVVPGVAPWLHSTYTNTYNPATKTFWMHYGYGVGSTSQNGWTRQVYEKWVRQ